ncbi:aminotransferase class I/II-fold pyridoxal phosphate-dependent enzyme [Clostridium neuense]|uniref:Aminotransferase class I/II-fold pyridoxal phosphate-dependent enzyme n=1 Tax=Clostridium neuense TaxID=1728934 RepID=A0ABW8TBK8_9CLOT
MKINNRLSGIEEYHFKKIESFKNKLINEGKDILDLSIGDPDITTNKIIIDEFLKSVNIEGFNKYPPYDGIRELKVKIIEYYKERFNVNLKEEEVLILIGSKEGINNIIPAVCNIGDFIIVPNPCYQVYVTSPMLWGVNTYKLPIREKSSYLPELNKIPESIAKKSKMFIINYPNNPTGAEANDTFFKDIIKFCTDRDIILVNDSAYMEIVREGKVPISMLQFDKAKKSVEIGTFSKTFNMTGFRIGYAVGNSKVLKELLKVKSNVDSGQFLPIQYAAARALDILEIETSKNKKIYDARREKAKNILKAKNIEYYNSEATFYIWCKVPKGYSTTEFYEKLIWDYGIITTPGYSFGNLGNGYFRLSLTKDLKDIYKYLNKIEEF